MSTEQFLEYLHTSPATARLAESLAEVFALRGHPVPIPVEPIPVELAAPGSRITSGLSVAS